jgi:hypothetical protein
LNIGKIVLFYLKKNPILLNYKMGFLFVFILLDTNKS